MRLDAVVGADGRELVRLLLTNHDRGASQYVARSNDTIFCKNQHGARALDLTVYHVDTLNEGGTHINDKCHQLCLIQVVGTLFAEVHALGKQFIGNLAQVVDFCNGHHGIAAQM